LSKDTWPHLVILSACAGILAGVWLLSPPSENNGGVQLFGLSLPPVCSFRRMTGLPCPGCGLTRSMTEIIHGKFSAGFACHSLGLMTFIYILLQVVYRGIWLLFPRIRKIWEAWGFYLDRAFVYLAVLYGLNWINQLVWQMLPSDFTLCLL